jgi:peptidase E
MLPPMSVERHVVGLSGCGFLVADRAADDFILSLARRQPARIAFLPTASGDAATYVARFHRAFGPRGCVATDVTFFDSPTLRRFPPRTADIEGVLLEQDVIYVGGGNTVNMLAIWRAHGVDRILRRAWEEGVVLCGVSAGMICWFEASLTDSFGGIDPLRDGLGLVAGGACPYYGEQRRQILHPLVAAGFPSTYAVEEGVGLHFRGDGAPQAFAIRPGLRAFHVRNAEGGVVEESMAVRVV